MFTTCGIYIAYVLIEKENNIFSSLFGKYLIPSIVSFILLISGFICFLYLKKGFKICIGTTIIFVIMISIFFYLSNNKSIFNNFYYNPFPLALILGFMFYLPVVIENFYNQTKVLGLGVTVKQLASIAEFSDGKEIAKVNKNNEDITIFKENNKNYEKDSIRENSNNTYKTNSDSNDSKNELLVNGHDSDNFSSHSGSTQHNFEKIQVDPETYIKNMTFCQKFKNIIHFIFCHKSGDSLFKDYSYYGFN